MYRNSEDDDFRIVYFYKKPIRFVRSPKRIIYIVVNDLSNILSLKIKHVLNLLVDKNIEIIDIKLRNLDTYQYENVYLIRLRDIDVLLKYFKDKELNNFIRFIKYEFLGKQYEEEERLKRELWITARKHEKEIKREEEKLRKRGRNKEKRWEEEKRLAKELKVELDEYVEKLEKKLNDYEIEFNAKRIGNNKW
nr:MAG TPA: hypothetical protein [Caudoviricetes sp.]